MSYSGYQGYKGYKNSVSGTRRDKNAAGRIKGVDGLAAKKGGRESIDPASITTKKKPQRSGMDRSNAQRVSMEGRR